MVGRDAVKSMHWLSRTWRCLLHEVTAVVVAFYDAVGVRHRQSPWVPTSVAWNIAIFLGSLAVAGATQKCHQHDFLSQIFGFGGKTARSNETLASSH